MPRTPTIELDLITTDGMRLCRLAVDLNHFRETNSHTSEARMLKHLSTLLPRGIRFTDETRRSLRGPLARLREDRQAVMLRDVRVEKRAAGSSDETPFDIPDLSADVARYRRQRDQARAELKVARREKSEYKQRLAEARESNATLTKQNAKLAARNSRLSTQVEELQAEKERYREQLLQAAADLQEYRDRLRGCERRLEQLTPSELPQSEDPFG